MIYTSIYKASQIQTMLKFCKCITDLQYNVLSTYGFVLCLFKVKFHSAEPNSTQRMLLQRNEVEYDTLQIAPISIRFEVLS